MNTKEKEILSACFEGNAEAVKTLLSSDHKLASVIDADGEDWEAGSSTLTLACCKGSLEIIELLLDAGADINAVSKDGTALAFASFAGHVDVVKYLLESGADPNAASSSGESPLHAAALVGNARICELLIERGANPNVRTTTGTTDLIDTSPPVCGESPLHLAVANGHSETVTALLGKGADRSLEDHTGQKPIHWAGRYNQKALIPLLK